MHHYTYRLIDENGIAYIGARSSHLHPENDVRYMSSSKYVRMAIANGIKFSKQILAIWPTRMHAIEHEIRLHDAFDVANSNLFYNKAKQTSTAFDTSGAYVSEETRAKRRAAMIKRYGTLKKDYRIKGKRPLSQTKKGWPKGKKQPPEMVANRAKAQTGKTGMQNNKGAKPIFALNLKTKKVELLVGRRNIVDNGFDPSTVHKICYKKPSSFTHKQHTFRFLNQEEIKMFVLETE